MRSRRLFSERRIRSGRTATADRGAWAGAREGDAAAAERGGHGGPHRTGARRTELAEKVPSVISQRPASIEGAARTAGERPGSALSHPQLRVRLVGRAPIDLRRTEVDDGCQGQLRQAWGEWWVAYSHRWSLAREAPTLSSTLSRARLDWTAPTGYVESVPPDHPQTILADFFACRLIRTPIPRRPPAARAVWACGWDARL